MVAAAGGGGCDGADPLRGGRSVPGAAQGRVHRGRPVARPVLGGSRSWGTRLLLWPAVRRRRRDSEIPERWFTRRLDSQQTGVVLSGQHGFTPTMSNLSYTVTVQWPRDSGAAVVFFGLSQSQHSTSLVTAPAGQRESDRHVHISRSVRCAAVSPATENGGGAIAFDAWFMLSA